MIAERPGGGEGIGWGWERGRCFGSYVVKALFLLMNSATFTAVKHARFPAVAERRLKAFEEEWLCLLHAVRP